MRVKAGAVLQFTGLMAKLLESGTTADRALRLCRDMGKGTLRGLCDRIHGELRRGRSFAETLKDCGVFPPLYGALAEIGEATGTSAAVFRHLAVYLGRKQKGRHKIQGALAYPAFVLFAAASLCAALFVFVLPRMKEIFTAFGAGRAEESVGGMYRSVMILALVLAALVFLAAGIFCLYRFSESAAYFFDRLILRLPFAGAFVTAVNIRDFFFAMELCAQSGMNVKEALGVSGAALGNRAYRAEILETEAAVGRGESIAAAFDKPLFPSYVGAWLGVGESTGEVETTFSRIREFFEDEAERRRETLMGLAEPVLILAAGIIILVLVINLVIPLYELYGGAL
ncbi:MAG: type II secretion system F family protein [Treponema sp.]|jgi:type II secretory pathway component PulF|nr:type II secretion system F family protein [Treponema sp.]